MAENVTIDPGASPSVTVATDEVTVNSALVQVQRVKAGWGADGAYNDPSVATPLPTQVIAAPADPFGANADALVAAGAAGSISAKLRRLTQGIADLAALLPAALTTAGSLKTALFGYTGSAEVQIKAGSDFTTGAVTNALQVVQAFTDGYQPSSVASLGDNNNGVRNSAANDQLYNLVGYDRKRGNTETMLLASAARTVVTGTPNQQNINHRGVMIEFEVTAKTGATTFQILLIRGSVSGQLVAWASGTVAAAVGTTSLFICYPGVAVADFAAGYTTGDIVIRSVVVPRNWAIHIYPSDSSSVTYSVRSSEML